MKYRTLRENVFIHSIPFPKAGIFEWKAWPRWMDGEVEPADEDARIVFEYFKQQRCNPWLLPTPYGKDGTIFLPAVYPDPRSRELLGIRPGTVTDQMPRYILGADKLRVGSTDHVMGDSIVYLGWPINGLLKPVNDVARLIAEYHEVNHAHPDLPVCPWNLYDSTAYLPELEARPGRRVDYNPPNGDWPTHPKPRQMRTNYNPLDAA